VREKKAEITEMMSLSERLAAAKQNNKPEVMYTVEGATFQEYALSNLDFKGSVAHKSIGTLVTAINNNQITVEAAKSQFIASLVK
jgi:hypothetical protein